MPRSAAQSAETTATGSGPGLLYALGAYGLWGFLPLYFLILAPTGAFEIVAWRVLFSLVFCAIVLTIIRGWRRLGRLIVRPRLMLMMGLAGALIFVNWQTYVFATLAGHVVEAALGYFINPVVTIFLGVIVLRERLRPAQWASVGISILAVIVLGIGYGNIPWIALALAFSFGLYGLAKKRVGRSVDALSGLTIETLWLAPVAGLELVYVASTTGVVFGTGSGWLTLGLLGAGVITAVPLLLFASAARRLPLSYLGFVQYLTPSVQFLLGVFVLHEPMPLERLLGFGLVWLALLVLTLDLVRHGPGARRASAELI